MKNRPNRPYPQVSFQKETALLLIEQGFSYRKVSKSLSLNATIISQWSKRDPEFKKILDRIETERYEAYRKVAFSYPNFDALDPLRDFQIKLERAYKYGELYLSIEDIEAIREKLEDVKSILSKGQNKKEVNIAGIQRLHQVNCEN